VKCADVGVDDEVSGVEVQSGEFAPAAAGQAAVMMSVPMVSPVSAAACAATRMTSSGVAQIFSAVAARCGVRVDVCGARGWRG
jgi:hypothetical protein